MLSMRPKNALPKARKRHELSSGIMRKRSIEACEGRASSGGSVVCAFRVRESGLAPGVLEGMESFGSSPTALGLSLIDSV